LRNGWTSLDSPMNNKLNKVVGPDAGARRRLEIEIRPELLELGVDVEEIQRYAELWAVIHLFKQGKVSSTEAGNLLGMDRNAFLNKLDDLEVLYVDKPGAGEGPMRAAPVVSMLAEDRAILADLNRELVRINRRLREANHEIREADRLKSEFVATISHELRTPLNTIIGFAKFMLKGGAGPLSDLQRTDLSAIYSSGQHLLDLVNDILDLSKIEAGKISLEKQLLDFHGLSAGIMSSAIALIGDRPIELKEEIDPDLPLVWADRQRVRQVILNLISNAAKFTENGQITLKAKLVREQDSQYVLCAVEDSGIGIRQEDIPTVFEAFRQVDSSSARRAQGTGLGLPISRRLVELQGGRMWVESEYGVGSTFYFTLPARPDGQVSSAEEKTNGVRKDS
jgi:signal transduction histidine kinase